MLSDIHGNLQALERAAAEIRAWRPERVWFLGDLVLFGPQPKECVALLRSALAPEICIEGNTDRHLREAAWAAPSVPEGPRFALEFARDALAPEDHEYLRDFARGIDTEAGGVRFHLCHGAPGNDEARLSPEIRPADLVERVRPAAGRVVLCGHTHVPWRGRVTRTESESETEILNDGSVGFPFDGDPRGAWLAIEAEAGALARVETHRFDFDRERTIALVAEFAGPMGEILIRRLRTARP